MSSEPKKLKLDSSQRQAVTHGQGPLLIIAGAGTGKTTVVTRRVEYLVVTKKVRPESVLALTFTEKAAREMEERVDRLLPYGYTDMWISTFHSFCDRVLRRDGVEIGLNPAYRLMAQAEAIDFFKRNLFSFPMKYYRPLGNPAKFLGGLLTHFSRLSDEDVTPKKYLAWVKNNASIFSDEERTKYTELATVYDQYSRLKTRQDVVDFSDLIRLTLQLFRRRTSVLARYRNQFEYLLVDEFQDTNRAQNELAFLLAGKKANITAVGDDDQSIYRFRGAAVANINSFCDRFPKAKKIVLKNNYRSGQQILNRAYRLIQYNNPDRLEAVQGINKHLKAQREEIKGRVSLLLAKQVEDEAEQVVAAIKGAHQRGYRWGEMAILVRANNHAEPFSRALARAGVPYQFLGPGKLLRQEEVKDLIAYLRLLNNFEDDVACYRVLSLAIFDLSPRDLAALVNAARRENIPLYEALEKAGEWRVSEKTKEWASWFVKMFGRHLGQIRKETAGQVLYYFLQDSGLLKKMTDFDSVTEEKVAQNIAKFFDRLKKYEADHEDASVASVMGWLNLSLELGESPLAGGEDWTQENKVNLLTIHSSKGLEFSVVFLVNLVAARFPSRNWPELIPLPNGILGEDNRKDDFHLQEERRLAYVGLTRARDELYLTAARFYGEAKQEKKPSVFVDEVFGSDRVEKVFARRKETGEKPLTLESWEPLAKQVEEAEVHPPLEYLSFTQLSVFETCPLQYRYRYRQRIPTPWSAAQSFGSSVHRALELWYQALINGHKPTQSSLLTFYQETFAATGYADRLELKKMMQMGEKMLVSYRRNIFKPKKKVLELEKSFSVKLGPDFKIGGKIDRIDRWRNGVEIIDYKTGRVWDDKKVENSDQMTMYALAAAHHGSSLRLGFKPEEVKLSFVFLQTGEIKSTKRTAAQLKRAQVDLLATKEKIEQSRFSPTPGRWCDFCDYKLICEAWE